MASLHYRPEIDGLRAFAVVAVIAFHLWGDWIPGGFLGVDVFFVISGYLITSIIATELETGSFSFRGFWARRIRRIIPAMLLVTLAAAVLSSQFTFPPDRPHLGIQATSALLSGANVRFWRTMGNYWGSDAETSPFLHLWSLSVEEQFYLFYPVLLFIICRWTTSSRRWIVGVLLTIFTFSLMLFLAGTQMAPTATFYLLKRCPRRLPASGRQASHLRRSRGSKFRSAEADRGQHSTPAASAAAGKDGECAG